MEVKLPRLGNLSPGKRNISFQNGISPLCGLTFSILTFTIRLSLLMPLYVDLRCTLCLLINSSLLMHNILMPLAISI